MTPREEEPWSPYEYLSSWLTNVEYRLKGGYAYIEIPQGTVLYHASQRLPITLSASGKSALPDVLYPNAYLAERSKAKHWGFPFPFVLKQDVLLLDMLSGWNLTKLLERSDMSETEKDALREVTGFGNRRQLKAKSPINYYRNKPKLTTLWLLNPEGEQKRTVTNWVCSHGFQGFARDDLLIRTSKGPFDNGGHVVIAEPSKLLRPVRIVLSKLEDKDRAALLSEDRLVRSAPTASSTR